MLKRSALLLMNHLDDAENAGVEIVCLRYVTSASASALTYSGSSPQVRNSIANSDRTLYAVRQIAPINGHRALPKQLKASAGLRQSFTKCSICQWIFDPAKKELCGWVRQFA